MIHPQQKPAKEALPIVPCLSRDSGTNCHLWGHAPTPQKKRFHTMMGHGLRRLTRLVLFWGHRRPAATRPTDRRQKPSKIHFMTSPEDSICYPLPNPILTSIDKVLTYLWDNEFDSYFACSPKEQVEHIFNDICIVRSWIWNFDEPVCSHCPEMVRAYPSKHGQTTTKSKLREWLRFKV
jgi:hypothetical protein